MRPFAPFAAALVIGAAAFAPVPASAVAGGHAVDAERYPWMAAISSPAVFFRPGGQFCGGVLVRADKVLTAAHCLQAFRYLPGALTVTFGRSDLAKTTGGIRAGVKKIWINPAFHQSDFHGVDVEHDDIAILTLAKKVKIRPVGLGEVSGRTATILGWGETGRSGDTAVKLRGAEVPLVRWNACRRVYGASLDSGMTCAGSAKADSCQFDSGGPLLLDGKARGHRVIGLVSWGKGCAEPGYPGVYVHLAPYLKLIKKHL